MEAVREWAREAGFRECVLHAQTYVISFYERLGYTAEGEVFYEANIPHRKMRRKL
jgi:predicted GNAT family N-acyltransferase